MKAGRVANCPPSETLVIWKGCSDVKDHTRNLSTNTVAFACLDPQVAVLILDVIGALVSVLRWRQVCQLLLIAILSRLAESPSFELTHAEFSAALWPNLKDSAREEKFSKWLIKLKEDVALSNCAPIGIGKPRKERRSDGSFKSLPTLYLPGIFWTLFRAVQDVATDCDLLALDVRPRRAKVRAIVARWLKESGAVPIERTKKAEVTRRAKPTLPCACACASCKTCAAKPPLPADKLRKLPNEDFSADLDAFADRYYQHLRELGEVGKEFSYAVKRAYHALEVAELRAREIVETENKREVARQYIKLVGGQPK